MTTTEPKPRPRLPEWLRIKLPTSDTFAHTRRLLDELKLHTVCESAKCPTIGMLEQRDGDLHDCGRSLHAGLRFLRSQHGQTFGVGNR